MPEVAILAKAPIPGTAKTRLIPALGPEGAAHLQARLIARAVRTARAAAVGPVTLWCAPDCGHPAFAAAGVPLRPQPPGDLGVRMLAAFSGGSAVVLIGTDCPCLEPDDLRDAAAALDGADAAMAPAEDGGYGLIAAAGPLPALFEAMPWGTAAVAALTRARAAEAGLRLVELRTVWDVDRPEDLPRLAASGLLAEAFSHTA
jgi:uncharacterized protein